MVALRSLLKSPPRYGIGAPAVPSRSDLPTYLRITDIDDQSRFAPDPAVSVDSALSSNYQLCDGDLVVARTGNSVGKSYRYRLEDGPLVFAGFLMAVTPDPKRLDPRYLGQYLQTKTYWDWVRSESMRSGQPGINARQLASMPMDVPDIRNQCAIADYLEDVDSALASLERLIAKKRAIKQGLIQDLMIGRRRLPGFDRAWQPVLFGDLASPSRERTNPRGAFGRVVELEHLSSGTGVLLGDGDIADSVSPKTKFVKGDVLFGKLRAYLRKFWIADRDGFASTEIWVLRARPDVTSGSFLRYVVEQDSFIESASTAYGTHMPRSDWKVVSRYKLRLPPLDEQNAIGRVLRDADAEIGALKRRLEATRAIKQGMMQELLTGRTRLASSAAPA